MLPQTLSQPESPVDVPRDKARAEVAVRESARAWYADVDLNYQGVSLGDALTYDVQQIFGRLWARHLAGEERADGNANADH